MRTRQAGPVVWGVLFIGTLVGAMYLADLFGCWLTGVC